MSSSTGSPSRKMKWFKSMSDKIDRENRLQEKEAKKNQPAHGGKVRKPAAVAPVVEVKTETKE